ncbi:rab-GTPase-TBC domain-containing protein [Lasiosphaeria miniovina]|uniref:Rab-GTPase-TBC domain-containing protein n=1 Tax=Lasiosphaeria miniovina TaxID=1954250 RepID=A0AA40AVK6_9PEZI|nr:rab-GTPase-TBC domain-containing protein [Lasiosphaeria miniovina]KAK0722744.1 rab-GTPase-TBC domain-containing protein [Lasiosphaeria miniovina]
MRSYAEAKSRWAETLRHGPGIADLQRAVGSNGDASPCLSGCRSVCWKAFLLFQHAPTDQWPHMLRELRGSYTSVSDQHLRFIRHPKQLADLSFDPLADDPNSPWHTVRKDELVRSEILQDVRRLPDEPFYHQDAIQTMILDILFLYCKLHPAVGGYRQGMHELLAPIVYVVAQDAIDSADAAADELADATMVEMLDSSFIEHDAYALFSTVMASASDFYEVGSDTASTAHDKNTIVEKSEYIHEVALMKIDQELATHLRNIEVLPQIFLIRWIRLLFGREFPFDQLLVLWDTLFAFDPNLELIDLICVAMLLRLRWTLLEADYSVALQLMLKYPAPRPPNGPHTFVDDAIYLKTHFNAAGGVTLISKYTGRSLTAASTSPQPSTPSFQAFGSLRQRTLGAKSPLSSPARLLQQPGGVEALFQGAAKGVLERGEKLGINQAVRDAMGEIRRNVQGLHEARSSTRGSRISLGENRPAARERSLAVSLMERRNRQLAAMLDESITSLKHVAASKLEGEKEKHIEAVEIAASKVQFVKACLEDTSLELPEEEPPSLTALTISTRIDNKSPTVALDTTPVIMTSSAVEEARSALSSPESEAKTNGLATLPEEEGPQLQQTVHDGDKMDTDPPEENDITALKNTLDAVPLTPVSDGQQHISIAPTERPKGPIPTRSTLAQSSFSWMLEPDTTASSALKASSSPSNRSPSNNKTPPKKRHNPSRERNAFLFGEVTSGGHDEINISSDEIFGLQPMGKGS